MWRCGGGAVKGRAGGYNSGMVDVPSTRTGGRLAYLAGVRDMLPLALTVIPFGFLMGNLAAEKGLSVAETVLMSMTVFAGASQFAAVDIWREPVPVATLVLTVFLINLRHVLMGAALVRPLAGTPTPYAYGALGLLCDECWALAMRRTSAQNGRLEVAYVFGVSATMWLFWITSSGLGAALGGLLRNPERFGLDYVFTAVFLALLVGFWRGARSAVPWVVSAGVAVLASQTLPGVWFILAGGVAGTVTGALMAGDDDES